MDTTPNNDFSQQLRRQLAETYRGKKEYKRSFDAFRRYEQVYDSVFRREKETNKQDRIHKTTRIEQEAVLVQQQILLQGNEAALESKQMWLAGMAAGFVLLVCLCIFSYKNYQKKKRINEAAIKTNEQKAALVALQAERDGMNRERQKIATSLTQELRPLLEQIDDKLRTATRKEREEQDVLSLLEVQAAVRQARTAMEHALGDLSAISFLPLEERVTELIKTVPGSLRITLDIQGKHTFAPEQQQVVFHMIQELLQNIVKHARASQAVVKLHFLATGVDGEVSDNGIGFSGDPEQLGFGLHHIQRQIKSARGRFMMETYSGLRCIFFIPAGNTETDQ